ncbi:NADPH oxidase regulator NoxR [Hysterangium stoloniferum]|nr:NADPH oxidase regulator NoxR [Hysterangium stoloniferum]
MSLKAELETWAAALKAYDEEDFDKSLQLFGEIADSSKILTNMGLIFATLGEHEAAIENFNAATSLDQFLAVAYFQCGVSNFLLTRYDLALKDFEDALLYLRGNQAINYEQLGLKFKLYSAEVLFNKGLSQIYLGQVDQGLQDLNEASQEKSTPEHGVIDDAIQDRGGGYTVFSIPVGVLYRPSENKIKNSATKDYLGKAKLVAAADSREAYTTFTGVTRLQQGMTPTGAPLDRPDTDLGSALARSNTTLAPLPKSKPTSEPGPSLQRNATTINVVSREERQERLQAAAAGGPARGLSLRTAGGPGGAVRQRAARSPVDDPQQGPGKDVPVNKQSRITEIYDDYINNYNEEVPDLPPLPSQDPKQRVAAWAKNNANPAVRRGQSSGSNYAPSSYGGGGSMRRKSTRRTNYGGRSTVSGGRSTVYEEEEEGYVSGDYDDGPPELVKVLVKLHYKDDIRGMAIHPDMPFDEFLERVTNKFGTALNALGMKFKDEEGTRVSLRDDSDFDLAIETAKENARGKAEGKLEVWCIDQ